MLLKRLKYRFRAEAADGVELAVQLRIGDEEFTLEVDNNVLHVNPASATGDVDVTMNRQELIAIIARTKVLSDLQSWDNQEASRLKELIE